MTIKEIKAMFRSGDVWNGENTYNPNATGVRLITKVRGVDIIYFTNNDNRTMHMDWPKASQIIEARPGYLKFNLDDGSHKRERLKGHMLTLTKKEAHNGD